MPVLAYQVAQPMCNDAPELLAVQVTGPLQAGPSRTQALPFSARRSPRLAWPWPSRGSGVKSVCLGMALLLAT